MANTSGGGSFRSANEQALVGFFQNVLSKSQTTVSQTSGAIGQIGQTMTTTSTNLSGSNSSLQGGWSGPSATDFHNKATDVAKFSNTMGTDLGSSGGSGGVAGKLTTVATAMTAAQTEFTTWTTDWNNFLKTAAQQIAQAASNALATLKPVSNATASAPGFQAKYSIAVTVPTTAAGPSPALATATVTITHIPSRYGHNYGATMTQTLAPAYLSTQALYGAIQLAEVDQYLDHLRDSLVKLDSSYSQAATMPNSATGAVYTVGPDTNTNTNLGGGGLNGGAGTGTTTTPKTSAANGAGTGTAGTGTAKTGTAKTGTSGAGTAGTGTAKTGTGTSTSGLGTGTGTGTSLASTPTTTSGLGTTTTPTTTTIPTTGLGTTSTVPTTGLGTTGGVVPYVGTAIPTTSGSGLGSSKYGVSGTGVASESTPFSAASENVGTTGGTIGENTGAGTAAASGLASEAAGSTTTGRQMPYMPYMPMGQGMGGSDSDRKRSVWLDEEDVWATDSDPVPAVIGGDV
jgi:hypothetical protein